MPQFLVLLAGIMLHKQMDRAVFFKRNGKLQRRDTIFGIRHIDIGAKAQQQFENDNISVSGGNMDRGLALSISCIYLSLMFKQQMVSMGTKKYRDFGHEKYRTQRKKYTEFLFSRHLLFSVF